MLLLKMAVATRSLQEMGHAVCWGAKATRRTSSIASIALYGRTRLCLRLLVSYSASCASALHLLSADRCAAT